MRKLFYIFASLSVLALITCAPSVLSVFSIDHPGATGMNNQVDVDFMKVTDSRYSENVDITDEPGLIKRRKGIKRVAGSDGVVYGATGYYDETWFNKSIVGVKSVTAGDSIYSYTEGYYNSDSGYVILPSDSDKYFIWPSGTKIGELCASDTFGIVLSDTLPMGQSTTSLKERYVKTGTYQDFVKYDNMLIHSDGNGLPSVYHNHFTELFDVEFSPHHTTLTLPRPGQLRARILDYEATTNLNGFYEYTYQYGSINASCHDTCGKCGDTGFHSIIIHPLDQVVMLDGFQSRPLPYTDTLANGFPQPTHVYVLRRNLHELSLDTNWVQIIDFFFRYDQTPMIIDSGQNTGYLNTTGLKTSNDSVPMPGQLVYSHKGTFLSSNTTMRYEDDTVTGIWICYSFYDPETGIESALGPPSAKSQIVKDTSWNGSDSICLTMWAMSSLWDTTLFIPESRYVSPYIRVYRSITASAYVGADDSTVQYLRLETQLPRYNGLIAFGALADSKMVNDRQWEYWRMGYSRYIDATTIMRPTNIAPLSIPFTDMEYSGCRLWGIGDPLYPQRLYYSGIDDINDWDVNYYLSLDEGENDELIGIEKTEGLSGDVLYAFKHNSIYILTGTDPEYDLQVYRMTDEVGGVNRFGIIKVGDAIYFMSPEHRVYRLMGRQAQWISQPIQGYIDSVFTDSRDDDIRAYLLADKINFIHSGISAPEAISYNLISGTWSIEAYAYSTSFAGSFRYDTSQNQTGFDQYSYWLYMSDTNSYALGNFYNEWDSLYDSLGYVASNGDTASIKSSFDWAYQTPYIGDGEYVYQIRAVQISADIDDAQQIIAAVYDQYDNLLVSDTITADDNSYGNYYFAFPEHSDKYLSVRFSGYIKELNNVKITQRRLGRAPIP